MLTLLLVLGCGDDAAQAGAFYREALEALRENHYDDAVARLQEALKVEPRETDKLLYRDREGRHREAYYPHYVWAQARILQSRGESRPVARQEQLREALLHLDLTEHPDRAGMLARTKADLSDLERASTAPPLPEAAMTELRHRIANLCDQERFGESMQLLSRESELLNRDPTARDQLIGTIDERRRTAIARYERAMALALDTLAAGSPLEKPDSMLLVIQPALFPASLGEKPGASFLWLSDLQALFQRELPVLRHPEGAFLPELLRTAGAFEAHALRAWEAGSFAGFRAAANVADAIRETRIAPLKDGRDDVGLGRVLGEWELALEGRRSILSRKPGAIEEVDAYRVGVLQARADALHKIRERMEGRIRLRRDLDLWLSHAERFLEDPATMASPRALRTAASDGSSLEHSDVWAEIAPGLRSRALFLHALLELVLGMLENGPPERIREQAGGLIRSARLLDPEVAGPWRDKLSPKIRAWLEESTR